MDFLVARLPKTLTAQDFTATLAGNRLSTVEGGLQYRQHGQFLLALPAAGVQAGDKTYWFDGHATIGSAAFSSSYPDGLSADSLADYTARLAQGSLGKLPVSGVFTVLSVARELEGINIFLDPLSQYNLFHLNQGGLTAFSNNIYFLEALANAVGVPLKRAMTVAGQEALLGFGGGPKTGVDGISLLPLDSYVSIKPEQGIVAIKPLNMLPAKNLPVAERLEMTAESLSASLAAIQTSFSGHDTVYDLTGGIDSRFVLAASRAAGVRGQHYFRSMDGADHDTAIPDMIAHRFGLSFASFPENFDGEAVTRETMAKRAVFRQQGQSTIYNFELGRCRVNGVCRVRGGFGEITRAIYRGKLEKGPRWKWRHFMRSLLSFDQAGLEYALSLRWPRSGTDLRLMALLMSRWMGARSRFFTKGFRARLVSDIYRQFKGLRARGLQDDILLNGLYLTDRSRRHFGYMSQVLNLSRPSFEPLANIDLWYLACAYNKQDWENGQVAYDLMQRLDPELLAMPLVSSALTKSTAGFMPFEGNTAPGIPAEVTIKQVEQAHVVGDDGFRNTCLAGHALEIMPLTGLFFELVMSLDGGHDVWSVLDRCAFEELAGRSDRNEVVQEHALTFLRLLYGLIWVHGLEDRTPIDRII